MNLSTFLNLLSVIGILFLLLVTGYICRKTKIIDDVASKRLSRLIIMVGQPMMIIGALLNKEFSVELLKQGLFFTIIGFILHPLMAFFAYLIGPLYRDLTERKISRFSIIFTNCGFLGFPILEAIFPGRGAFNGAFFLIGFHIYIWTLGIWILSEGREDVKLTPKKALLNPGTIPCVIGFGLYLLKAVVVIPPFAIDFTNHLGNLCLPISVLITGGLMAKQGLKSMLTNARLYLFNLIKLIAVPVAVCFVAKLVTLGMADHYNIVMFCTVMASLPSAATITMLTELYDMKPEYAAQTVGSTSLLSLGTLPLLYFIGDLVARL